MKMILKPLYMKPRDLSPIAKPEQASEKKTVSFFVVCGCFVFEYRGHQSHDCTGSDPCLRPCVRVTGPQCLITTRNVYSTHNDRTRVELCE